MATVGVFAAVFDGEGRILCVRRAYGPKTWTTPGGRVEVGESPIEALEREVKEETGYSVQTKRLLGAYSATFKDDLILSIEAEIVGGDKWQANEEISHLGFFGREELPQPMHPITAIRITDAFDRRVGVVRVFPEEDVRTHRCVGELSSSE
jgi:8-oxo-dGTP diphosphatase